MSVDALISHLKSHAIRSDGPFTLRSGEVSSWYIDARQTTLDGIGAGLVGSAVLSVVAEEVEAVGGMTMGADPISLATAMVAAGQGRSLKAFTIRKQAKEHGLGGRVVGPVGPGSRVAIIEDTTTTGGAAAEAAEAANDAGLAVVQAIALVDRSQGAAADRFNALGIRYVALVTPEALGVGS